ncbi:hypothetical protein EG329_003276 [Mollisiaceae sp. DMI_Dod_QoI]|nr:hypothetical protein EG329_003276 [Helotiales sp. DMI_Dod_QoI]
MDVLSDNQAAEAHVFEVNILEDKQAHLKGLNDLQGRDAPKDEDSTDPGGDQSSSSSDPSPHSSVSSIVPPREEEWDRTLRHIGLEDFGKALEGAARTIYPNNKSRYSKLHVLLIWWQTEDPNLPVELEIIRLRDVLENVYHFDIEAFQIPDSDPHAEVIPWPLRTLPPLRFRFSETEITTPKAPLSKSFLARNLIAMHCAL